VIRTWSYAAEARHHNASAPASASSLTLPSG